MQGGGEMGARRAVIYCVLPHELADEVHDRLRRHFRDDPLVEVVVEQRGRARRAGGERRAAELAPALERRLIRNREGRRIADRRATVVPVEAPELPRRLRVLADRLLFVERVEPSDQHAEDLDSARLVTRVQAGDQDAFATLYMRYFDRVYGYLRVLLRDSHEAEDATQQVFIRALEGLPRYERRSQPFRAWLFIIVRNYALNLLKKRERLDLMAPELLDRRRDLCAGAEPAPEPDVLDWISDRELMMFIERLPLAQRQVLALRYMLDLGIGEIATILSLEPNHVSVLQHRALAFLRERLTAVGRAPESGGRTRMRGFIKPAPVLRARRFSLLR